MECLCKKCSYFKGNEATKYEQQYLAILKVDTFKWKALYKCNFCETYWEEHYQDERFIGIPILNKVSTTYIKENYTKHNT